MREITLKTQITNKHDEGGGGCPKFDNMPKNEDGQIHLNFVTVLLINFYFYKREFAKAKVIPTEHALCIPHHML